MPPPITQPHGRNQPRPRNNQSKYPNPFKQLERQKWIRYKCFNICSLNSYTWNKATLSLSLVPPLLLSVTLQDLPIRDTEWKVSKYAATSGPQFPTFGLHTERYFVFLLIQSECWKIRTRNNSVFGHFSLSVAYLSAFSPNVGKYGPAITPHLVTFHALFIIFVFFIGNR